jgi:hypothetical protein
MGRPGEALRRCIRGEVEIRRSRKEPAWKPAPARLRPDRPMTAELLCEIATAWREAFAVLRAGRPCDLCPAVAGHVRFLFLERDVSRLGLPAPEGQGMMGFYLLCDACHRLPARPFEDRALDLCRAELRGREAMEPYWHPPVLGPRGARPAQSPGAGRWSRAAGARP